MPRLDCAEARFSPCLRMRPSRRLRFREKTVAYAGTALSFPLWRRGSSLLGSRSAQRVSSSMRKTIVALVVIGLVWAGYTAWPLYELMVLVRAIDARDLTTVAQHVNFDRVRVSLTEQVTAAYLRRSGINPGPFSQQAVIIGLSIADPIVTKLVSPEALSDLLALGWPVAVIPDAPPSTVGINSDTLGTAWQLFAASHYGIARFEISVPTALPPANRFRLIFQLLTWRWQLVGIILPENIQNLLADELIKAIRERR